MALFELDQEFGTEPEEEWKPPTFKDCAAADIDLAFFQEHEHAEWHTVDGKKALIILESEQLKERAAHWEAGAKQNFDTGLYTSRTVRLYPGGGLRAEAQGRQAPGAGQGDEDADLQHSDL